MAKQRTKKRISSKIDELPEDVRTKVDVMLADTSNTYTHISQYLKVHGYEVSKSSVGRYAMRSNAAMQRILEAQALTNQLAKAIREDPDADYSDAAMRMLMHGLVGKMATAEEEFNELPLDKAGRLIASLARTKTYKDKVKQDMAKKAELAFEELEAGMMQVIRDDAQLAGQLKQILSQAKERMMDHD